MSFEFYKTVTTSVKASLRWYTRDPLWHRNNFTVTEKYFILWQGNTLYSGREILFWWQRNTLYCNREILCIPSSSQYLNMESRKSEIQPSLLSWPQLKIIQDQQSQRNCACIYTWYFFSLLVSLNFSKYSPLAIPTIHTPISYAIQIMESSVRPLVTE